MRVAKINFFQHLPDLYAGEERARYTVHGREVPEGTFLNVGFNPNTGVFIKTQVFSVKNPFFSM